MANLKKQADSVRPVLTVDELSAIIMELDLAALNKKLDPYAELGLMKLRMHNFKVTQGINKPAYTLKGRPVSVAKMNPSDLLGALTDGTDNNTVQNTDTSSNEPDNNAAAFFSANASYTAEQKADAEFAAADHFIMTGEHKDWKEFL